MTDEDSAAARLERGVRQKWSIVRMDILAPIVGFLLAFSQQSIRWVRDRLRWSYQRLRPTARAVADGGRAAGKTASQKAVTAGKYAAIAVAAIGSLIIVAALAFVAISTFRSDTETEQSHSYEDCMRGKENPDEPGPEPETIRRAEAEAEEQNTQDDEGGD